MMMNLHDWTSDSRTNNGLPAHSFGRQLIIVVNDHDDEDE